MPSLDALLRNTAQVDVPFAGEIVKVTYKPGVMTEEFLGTDESVVDTLTALVVSWDLTTGTGKSKRGYPITKASLAKLPLPLLRAILLAILGDGTEVREEGNS